jgi:hypothetical protein
MTIEHGRHRDLHPPLEQVSKSVDAAIKSGMLWSFVVRGPVNEKLSPHFTVVLQELPSGEEAQIRKYPEDKYYDMSEEEVIDCINNIQIPPIARNYEAFRNMKKYDSLSRILLKHNTPIVMLEIGESSETEQLMIQLSFVKGISIGDAIVGIVNTIDSDWDPVSD